MQDQHMVRYCPYCGSPFNDPKNYYADFYWVAEQIVQYYWCRKCFWKGEVTRIERIIATMPEE